MFGSKKSQLATFGSASPPAIIKLGYTLNNQTNKVVFDAPLAALFCSPSLTMVALPVIAMQ